MVFQWLRLCVSSGESGGSIPDWGTKIFPGAAKEKKMVAGNRISNQVRRSILKICNLELKKIAGQMEKRCSVISHSASTSFQVQVWPDATVGKPDNRETHLIPTNSECFRSANLHRHHLTISLNPHRTFFFLEFFGKNSPFYKH